MNFHGLAKGVVAVLLAGGLMPSARAGLSQILNPTGTYVSNSVNIPILVTNSTLVTTLSDATVELGFSLSMRAGEVGVTWDTWSSPPFSESATPRVLSSRGASSLVISFSTPLILFGVETEPNILEPRDFTITYFNGSNVVGFFNANIDGDSGARLLAASATGGDEFTSVEISTVEGFALAQFRYAVTSIPEPATGLVLAVAAAAGVTRRRRR